MDHSHNKIIAGAELSERFEACILAGAIGDAWGSSQENQTPTETRTLHPWGEPKREVPLWALTDDTQLTLATCEALDDPLGFSPEVLSAHFVDYFKRGKITGAGGSTLKALVELEAGSIGANLAAAVSMQQEMARQCASLHWRSSQRWIGRAYWLYAVSRTETMKRMSVL